MITDDRPECQTCPHWIEVGGDDRGECRRFPPVPVYEIRAGMVAPQYWVWPEIDAWMGCGEHPDFPAWVAGRREKPHG